MEDMKIPGSKYVVGNPNSTSFEVEIKEYHSDGDKKTWEGREWLRSIGDEHHYWHLLAGLILIGSIVASAYILSHPLVCAPASLEGKTVINCVRK